MAILNRIFRSRRVDRLEAAIKGLEQAMVEREIKINASLSAIEQLVKSAPGQTDRQCKIMAQKIFTELSGAMHKLSMQESAKDEDFRDRL